LIHGRQRKRKGFNMADILDLSKRISLVTGAGQGIGRQIALQLSQATNSGGVAVNDYVLDRARAVVEEIREAGGRAIAVQADVTDLAAVKAMVQRVESELGPVGVLVNNAGNVGAHSLSDLFNPFWEMGPEQWNAFIGVNFYGVINCTAAVVPKMIERRESGRIITIISDAGREGEPGLEVYSGAKAGAAGFMRALARTLGDKQITANTISIAITNTPMVKSGPYGEPEALKRHLERYIIRRIGEPEDIANMALFLASDASSWISGQVYPVNGGYSLAL
jgi:3-oxoacyl-[acyl-carrier protein] reductase